MADSFEGRSTYGNEHPGSVNNGHSGARRFSRQGGRFRSADSSGGDAAYGRLQSTGENHDGAYEAHEIGDFDSASSGGFSGFQAVDTPPSYKRTASRYDSQKSRSDRGIRSKSGVFETNDTGGYVGYSVADAQKKNNNSKILAVVVGAIAVVVVAALIFMVYNFFQTSPSETQTVTAGIEKEIFIPEGSSTTAIAGILKNEGIIAKESTFISAVRSRGAESMLKPGKYAMTTGMGDNAAVDLLIAGPSATGNTLTIPEGVTLEQAAKTVEKVCDIPADAFIAEARSADKYYNENPTKYWFLANVYNNSAEGFLYPKTYVIPEGSDAAYVVKVLLDQFAIEIKNLDLSYAESRNLNLYDVMIMGSMIEKETYTASERELVSSVLYNRLRNNMKLQICATVVYVLGPDSRDYGINPLLYVDLEVESPYNTYLHDGLPPGPICSPQIASITAAARPAQTDYLYYVLTSQDGTHTFCATDAEFAAANEVYNRVFG
ncbi:MAG TPA: endolytic transglycosylase MltG [Coriobacteriia bacterium]|nr:endolytic transglycosylase MltG [Coriobacteriia bacterium]